MYSRGGETDLVRDDGDEDGPVFVRLHAQRQPLHHRVEAQRAEKHHLTMAVAAVAVAVLRWFKQGLVPGADTVQVLARVAAVLARSPVLECLSWAQDVANRQHVVGQSRVLAMAAVARVRGDTQSATGCSAVCATSFHHLAGLLEDALLFLFQLALEVKRGFLGTTICLSNF